MEQHDLPPSGSVTAFGDSHKSSQPSPRGVRDEVLQVYGPVLGEEEITNLTTCIRSGRLMHGPFVTAFETAVASYVGHQFGVGTNSGTAALHIALLLAGVRGGDEVLINTLTFIAPANTIRYVGAHPVFVDALDETWQLDPAALLRFVKEDCNWDGVRLVNRQSGRPVTAIILVHFLGMPGDVDAVMEVANHYNLKVIEDAAQALGTSYRGRRVGGIASIGCFSFYGNKLITAGGGGMIVTSDAELARKARYLVNQAKDDPLETLHNEIGYNYRMTNLHGAIGCAQFDRIETHISSKRAIADRYRAGLSGLPGLTMQAEPEGQYFTYWLSTVRIDADRFGMSARAVMALLRKRNIEAIPLYQPLHLSKAHHGAQSSGGAAAELLVDQCLSLPSSVDLAPLDQERVVSAVKEAASPITSRAGPRV